MGLKLIGEVSLDGSGFERGLRGLGSAASGLKNLIVGAFGTAAIAHAIRSTVDYISKLRDVSDVLGINVEFLQKLSNGAKLAGSDIEDVTRMVDELNKARADAFRNPTGANAQAFGRLGMSRTDISGLSTQDFTQKLIDAFKGGATVGMVTDVEQVGGKSARKLIGAFVNQFESGAQIIPESTIDAIDAAQDQFTELKVTLMADLAPAIKTVVEYLHTWINAVKFFAAILKGFFGTLDLASVLKNKEHPLKALAMLSENIKAAGANAILAGLGEHDRQGKVDEAFQQGLAAAIAARHKRETGSPDFSGTTSAGVPLAPKIERPTDALVSVGNFLGHTGVGLSGNSLVAIANRHVQVSKDQLAVLNRILAALPSQRGGIPTLGIQFP